MSKFLQYQTANGRRIYLDATAIVAFEDTGGRGSAAGTRLYFHGQHLILVQTAVSQVAEDVQKTLKALALEETHQAWRARTGEQSGARLEQPVSETPDAPF